MTVFIPGETIAYEFYIPFGRSDFSKIIVTFRQNDHIVLTKTVLPSQVTAQETGSHFAITLSQEESLLFEDNNDFFVQLNVVTLNSEVETRAACVEMKGSTSLQHYREVVS